MSLREYQRKRDFAKTSEPPAERKKRAASDRTLRFVIQKHAASHLHYDLRLELGGTLKSWAVPKGIPRSHGEKRLAVQVEDHPLEYANFEGTIPSGEYGAGTVMIWDHGTYTPETRSPAKDLAAGKLHFALEGTKLRGSWYLVRTRDEKNWLLIRGDDDHAAIPRDVLDRSTSTGRTMSEITGGFAAPSLPDFTEPMLAKAAARPPASGDWRYEIKFDGWRALALTAGSNVRLLSRNQTDLTSKFPDLATALAKLPTQSAILDGEIVALEPSGRSSFQLLQSHDLGTDRPPLRYYAFDLLQLDGEDLRSQPIEDRQARLAQLLQKIPDPVRLSSALGTDAAALLDHAKDFGLEGLIGKRAGSHYESGRRSGTWIKLKLVNEDDFVIGGTTPPAGGRARFGALIIGVREGDKLLCVGKVGSGFSDAALRQLDDRLAALTIDECPFANLPDQRGGKYSQGITRAEMKRCRWIEPTLACQVKFTEWTRDRHLRQAVLLGLRPDKSAPAPAVKASPLPAITQSTSTRDATVEVGDRSVAVTNLDKVFYPETGFTKGQVIDYYVRVSPVLLPHLRARPLSLKRYPDGVDGFHFYEKQCPAHRPDWVKTAAAPKSDGGKICYCVMNDLPALVWAANLANLELHPFQHRAPALSRPTALVFDLDPGEPAGIPDCCVVALKIKTLLDDLGLQSFPKTSGSKGLQLTVPLNTAVTYARTKAFARAVAELLESQHPDAVVSRMTKKLRVGKIFIDWSQNDQKKTTVCAYSLRGKDEPTVSTPVTWKEITAGSRKRSDLRFTSDDVLARIKKFGDLHAPVLTLKQKLPTLRTLGQRA